MPRKKRSVSPHFSRKQALRLSLLTGLIFNFLLLLGILHIQALDEEMSFVEAYTALLKIRNGDNLKVHYNIDEGYEDFLVMPVSVQLLVENAVKYNVISNKTPLEIDISTTPDQYIVVSNRVNSKLERSPEGGLGLSNLAERYSIIFKK